MILTAVALPLLSPAPKIAGHRLWNGGILPATPLASLLGFGADDLVVMLGSRAKLDEPQLGHDFGYAEALLELIVESMYQVDRRRLHACNRVASERDIALDRSYRDVNLYEAIRPSLLSSQLRSRDRSAEAQRLLDQAFTHGIETANRWLAQGPRADHIESTPTEPPALSEHRNVLTARRVSS